MNPRQRLSAPARTIPAIRPLIILALISAAGNETVIQADGDVITRSVGAYLFLLTDEYPALEEEQGVHLGLDFADVERDLPRGLPLVKWPPP